MLRGSQKSGTAQFMEGEGVELAEKHNGRNVIKPGSRPSSPSPIYLSYKTRPIFFRILPPRFFPDPIPILIIHLFVCYTAPDKEMYLSGLIFARIDFDIIVIPYLSVSNSPLRGRRPPPPNPHNMTTLGHMGQPITHSAEKLTSLQSNSTPVRK